MLQAWTEQARTSGQGMSGKWKGWMCNDPIMIMNLIMNNEDNNESSTKMENWIFTKECSVFTLPSLKILAVLDGKRLRTALFKALCSWRWWGSLWGDSVEVFVTVGPEGRWVQRGEVIRARATLPEWVWVWVTKRLPGSFCARDPCCLQVLGFYCVEENILHESKAP